MGNTYDEFATSYNKQWPAVFKVAQWLHANGHTVTISAPNLRPRHANPADYHDDGDITAEKDGQKKRIEVKLRDVDFTSEKDWPYKEGLMVHSTREIADTGTPISAWLSVSRDLKYAAIMTPETRQYWKRVTRYDRKRESEDDFYICPLDKVVFRKLEQEL